MGGVATEERTDRREEKKSKKITADTFVLEAMAPEQLERKKSIKKIIELVTYVITRSTHQHSLYYTQMYQKSTTDADL